MSAIETFFRERLAIMKTMAIQDEGDLNTEANVSFNSLL
ncbi:hypothetical protein BWQ96_09985 [Gracilariopsis chorda]|uniref:Uncharacterized protein n=1 Tax=Gracilariopsis chorda TaxID=448386 RepID=A0A2V3IE27_9FLOR|nr:hypothetical protein BWQ96_09985 [Gracilariopsis chorda]|eukprot:PXF40302.1 hypothetical protein BWQ96_09985 [Gracilariopsis chorda]